MNGTMVKALALDALYQVLDNRVFRILTILVLIPILITLLVGFREDGIVLLFGLKQWSYESMVGFITLGRAAGEDPDYQGMVVSNLVSLFVDTVGGTFGVMLAIAATAFFVPRMTEKGAADVLFHKPIPRWVLFLSRYFAGLLFIALLSVFAVIGMYVGLLLVSGYNDPGILWAPLTLTYAFGLVHCVSMLIGVMTRSTVAAILVTLIFYFGNGCVHQGWILKEQIMAQAKAEKAAEEREAEAAAAGGEQAEAGPSEAGAETDEEADPEEDDDELPLIARLALGTLDGFHFVLPKTTDAEFITQKLRASVGRGWAYEHPDTTLAVLRLEGGLKEVEPDAAPPPAAAVADLLGPPVFAASSPEGERHLVLRARELRRWEDQFAGRTRMRTESPRKTATELAEALRAALGAGPEDVAIEDGLFGTSSEVGEMGPLFATVGATDVRWEDEAGLHHLVVLGSGGHLITVELVAPPELGDERPVWEREVLRDLGLRSDASMAEWYPEQLGWNAPLRYNLFFSIGSSLLFALVMLAWGAWRLSRIDF